MPALLAHLRTVALSAPLILIVGAMPQPAWAQAQEKLLRGDAVTEANLLEALTPSAAPSAAPPAADGDAQVRSRGFKVSSVPGAGVGAKKPPAASLLITFETNSATLTSQAKELLNVVAGALSNDKLKPFAFTIVGHADVRGSPGSNMVLSQQRAEAVRQYLITVHHLPGEKLNAIGKGDTEPLNRIDIAAAENRRVAFVTGAK